MDDLFRYGPAVLVYFFVALRGVAKQRGEAGAAFSRALAVLAQWRRRARARRELAGCDDYLLRDIGVSRSQAQFESGKPFWQS